MSTESSFALGGEITVSRVGYGAMRLTGQPGNFGRYPDWEGGKALLRRAVELGVQFFDTARAYGPGDNEDIIAEALNGHGSEGYPATVLVATKGGVTKRAPDDIRADGRPETLRREVEDSLRRLRLERIDLYQLHRPDPAVPLEESVAALEDMRREGLLRLIGLSNVSLEQYEAAKRVAPIAAVQNRFSLADRSGIGLVRATARDGAAFIPHGPLGANPMRAGSPLARTDGALGEIARARDVQPSQIALAWLLAASPNVIVIPGTTSIAHLEENVAAARLTLDEAELERLGRPDRQGTGL